MTPKISIVIPVWNTVSWLSRCLDSVCGQTLGEIEIICVNDASPDESEIVLNEYATLDSRILNVTLGQNRG